MSVKPDYIALPRVAGSAAPAQPVKHMHAAARRRAETYVTISRPAFYPAPAHWPEPDAKLVAAMAEAMQRRMDAMATLAIYGIPIAITR